MYTFIYVYVYCLYISIHTCTVCRYVHTRISVYIYMRAQQYLICSVPAKSEMTHCRN